MGMIRKTCKRIKKMAFATILGIALGYVVKKLLTSDKTERGSITYNANVASKLYDARAKFESGTISKDQYEAIIDEL